jgi:3-dehydroquinate synthase
MERIQLAQYEIVVGNVQESLRHFLQQHQYSKILVLVDENTAAHCLPRIKAPLQGKEWMSIQVPAGEQHKNISTCRQIWGEMMKAGADRKALAINLGGGVIGDMGGFCASTFKRGMDFLQIPTTLLSQVDASIGGKLGIDFMQVKNSIGLFRDPRTVLIDPAFLQTLPFAEIRSGFAEIIKHSLIADAKQWQELRWISDLTSVDWVPVITPSLLIKKRIVEEDPFEKGLRKALNFGHTIGHAVEGHALETDRPLLHGEAIGIGMICETYLSHRIRGLPEPDLNEASRFLLSIYDAYPLETANYPVYLDLMQNDKKNEAGAINFSLIDAPGSVVINQTCSEELIVESLDYYNGLVVNV